MNTHPELEDGIATAADALAVYETAQRDAQRHALAQVAVRAEAIKRIMERDKSSFTAAEKLRDGDEDYAEWKRQDAWLAIHRGHAEFALWAARLRCEYLARALPPVAIELPL